MKIKSHYLSSFLVLFAFVSSLQAQYVTIPDPGMVNWLTAHYPSAMNGNQMDTTDNAIILENVIQITGTVILNLDGIQYFSNLDTLDCSFLNVTEIPALSNSLKYFNCIANNITLWPSLPDSLLYFDCRYNNLISLPQLPNSLQYFDCFYNQLSSLPPLPDSLKYLNCGFNNLTSLPPLPNLLKDLNCSTNNLTSLPPLPNSLLSLECHDNNLTSLPQLFDSIDYLDCSNNNLTSLPQLPNSLLSLSCFGNNLLSLPQLPNSLLHLYCGWNNLTTLPLLPSTLKIIYCNSNSLTSLPTIPNSLQFFGCSDNNLISMPQLPNSLLSVECNNNPDLSCLPMLPNTLEALNCSYTSIACLPNYPNNNVFESVLPICQPNNPNGCETSEYISGAFFNNLSNNCFNNANLTTNATLKLYDSQNNFLSSRSASSDDHYYFSIEPGNYVVRVDSSFLTNGVNLSCPVSGEHNVTAVIDSSYSDRDFGLNCVGIDLGVEAILPQGIVFPGQPHSLKAIAGDLSNYFGLNCAAGTGGSVEITVTGPVTYVDYPLTALAPVINGNTFTYTITDFSSINIQEAFILNFLTNTTAQATNVISVSVQITSNATDLDLTNNVMSFSYFVGNSFDPNMKEVNPLNVLPGYDDYFTYTIHFQNMGNAPAFNIKIKDTLDQNLDFETFRVINASHPYSYNLTGDLLNVYFPNIMLADSTSDPEGSKGFVQYQVKPKVNLPLGTTIENTAHIYFDFNQAVVTNTTINEYVQTLGLTTEQSVEFKLYPNPTNGALILQSSQQINSPCSITITDMLGKVVYQSNGNFNKGQLTLETDFSIGSYLLTVSNEKVHLFQERLVVIK